MDGRAKERKLRREELSNNCDHTESEWICFRITIAIRWEDRREIQQTDAMLQVSVEFVDEFDKYDELCLAAGVRTSSI